MKRGMAATEELVFSDAASVRAARADMPGDRMVKALAEMFRALSDPTRVRIISALAGQEFCGPTCPGCSGSPDRRFPTSACGTSCRSTSSASRSDGDFFWILHETDVHLYANEGRMPLKAEMEEREKAGIEDYL